jgi:uncharacterized protein YjbI with pentapeptide repeats
MPMAFKPNYRFERRERDRLKQARKEEKLKRQQERSLSRRDGPLSTDQLKQILDDHRAWLESGGEKGAKADLSHAEIEGALWRADLREADLSYASLRGVDLDHAQLQRADLRHADMTGASLWQANLRDADLRSASLRGAKLDHADLTGADLHETDCTGGSFWGARLDAGDARHAVGLTAAQLDHVVTNDGPPSSD